MSVEIGNVAGYVALRPWPGEVSVGSVLGYALVGEKIIEGHMSDFSQSEDKIVLDLVNYCNDYQLTLEQVTVGDLQQVVTENPLQVTVGVSAKEGSGFTGSVFVDYNRIDIASFVGVYFSDSLTLNVGESTHLSGLLDQINIALGTAIPFSNIIDVELAGWQKLPNEERSYPLTIAAHSKVYHGTVDITVRGRAIGLDEVVTLTLLGGLNMPVGSGE